MAVMALPNTVDSASRSSAPLDAGRRVLRTEAEALSALAEALDGSLRTGGRATGGDARPGRGDRHGQERPRRAQDRRHPGLDRHAGALRPSGRGQPRRSRHDHPGRRGAGAVQLGRDARAGATSSPTPGASRSRCSPSSAGRTARLAEAADLALVLPPGREACPMGLAPTTSTTCMLALGDALAVALLERRGFWRARVRLLHPGGKLGKQAGAGRGADASRRRIAAGRARHAACRDVLLEMTAKRLGCVGVRRRHGRAGRDHHRWRSAPPHAGPTCSDAARPRS